MPARRLVREARQAADSGDWQAAADCFDQALALAGTEAPANWHLRASRAHLRLGAAHERAGQLTAAAQRYARALEVDPQTSALDRRLLGKGAEEFRQRRTVARLLAPRIEEIRERALDAPDVAGSGDGPVFSLWLQGLDDAPPVVRACHRQLHRVTAREVVWLDGDSLPGHVRLPDDIDALDLRPAHRADLLRLELLAASGGTWLDATCLVREDFDDRLQELMGSGFFAFAKNGLTLSNWLLAVSNPQHYVIRMLREALHAYWRSEPRRADYYVFHHAFEALVELDDRMLEIWSATPRRAHDAAHLVQRHQGEAFDPRAFEEYLAATFVQKLTYKYAEEAAAAGTVLGHLLETY